MHILDELKAMIDAAEKPGTDPDGYDPDDALADLIGVRLNGSRWSKIVETCSLGGLVGFLSRYVPTLIAAVEAAEAGDAFVTAHREDNLPPLELDALWARRNAAMTAYRAAKEAQCP